jgi:hypothetical protein
LHTWLPGFPLQRLEQHCELFEQAAPDGLQLGQEGLPEQLPSPQSTAPSQSSSTPSLQLTSEVGGLPQSAVHEHASLAAHWPSPHPGGGDPNVGRYCATAACVRVPCSPVNSNMQASSV